MRIGIFGGAFDPVHLGHLMVAEDVAYKLHLDKLLFVPSFQPPHRPAPIAPYHHRVKMLQLATQHNSKFGISTIEKELPVPSYTINTLSALRPSFPGASLYLILGYDQYKTIAAWHRPADLTRLARLVVISRPGIGKPPRFRYHNPARLVFLPVIPVAISAALIRCRLSRGLSIFYLVPTSVSQYIYQHKIYLKAKKEALCSE